MKSLLESDEQVRVAVVALTGKLTAAAHSGGGGTDSSGPSHDAFLSKYLWNGELLWEAGLAGQCAEIKRKTLASLPRLGRARRRRRDA